MRVKLLLYIVLYVFIGLIMISAPFWAVGLAILFDDNPNLTSLAYILPILTFIMCPVVIGIILAKRENILWQINNADKIKEDKIQELKKELSLVLLKEDYVTAAKIKKELDEYIR